MSARRRHAVIVDDERLARRELRTLLEDAHGEHVHVVGEADTVATACRAASGSPTCARASGRYIRGIIAPEWNTDADACE